MEDLLNNPIIIVLTGIILALVIERKDVERQRKEVEQQRKDVERQRKAENARRHKQKN